MLVLEGKNQASERLTAIDKVAAFIADEHVTSLEKDAFEDAHNVVDLQALEKTLN